VVKNIKYRTEQKLTYKDTDDNYNALAHFTGTWNAVDQYTTNEVVRHEGGVWICVINNNGIEPSYEQLPVNGGVGHWTPLQYPGSANGTASSDQTIGNLSAFTTVEFDSSTITPYGCTMDTATNTFTIDFAGIWQESVSVFFAHDSSNNGRSVRFRVWNVTQGSEEGGVTIGIGRNVEDSNTSFQVMTRFLNADTGDSYRWEIGPNDGTVNSVDITAFVFNLVQLSI